MKCSDIERVLPEMIEGERESELRSHLENCPACSELVSDLKLIASEARQLAEDCEPPARVWVNIANQLRAEGLIRDAETSAQPVPVPARRRAAWWWLAAPVAAALVVAGSYIGTHRPAPQVANQQTVTAPATETPNTNTSPAANATTETVAKASKPATQQKTSSTDNTVYSPPGVFADTASQRYQEDQRFLDDLSQRAPGMKATYENELNTVNSYIQDAENYLKQNPGDDDARQHLMEAYEQRAMLYQMALDHIQ